MKNYIVTLALCLFLVGCEEKKAEQPPTVKQVTKQLPTTRPTKPIQVTETTTRPVQKTYKTNTLALKYPRALFIGTPVPINEPNINKSPSKPYTHIKVPKGTKNLALNKPVTSNESLPVNGTLDMITDGVSEGDDGNEVDIGFGCKWIQVDLKAICEISFVRVWHYHKQARAYRDVIVKVSNDVDLIESTIVFNSDHDNSSGMGIGDDFGYVETNHGKLIWCPKGQKARYVRFYSKGSTSGDNNHYVEVEIYGRKKAE